MIGPAEGELGRPSKSQRERSQGGEAEQQQKEQAARLRWLLLPAQLALRPRARRPLHHLPPPPARGPRPTASASPPDARPPLGELSRGL